MTTPPRPGKPWTCQKCELPIGFITKADELIVTMVYTVVENARYGTIVRCSCGQPRVFNGRCVRVNPPIGRPEAA